MPRALLAVAPCGVQVDGEAFQVNHNQFARHAVRAAVGRLVGYGRFEGLAAAQTLSRLNAAARLAAAVSEAGGRGHLACTWRSPMQLDALFRRMYELTTRPYGANFVLDFQIDDKLEAALAHQVPIVSFFWGNAGSYVPRLKAAGALAIQVVGSVAEAAHVAEAGFDLIVAQGHEAGGHICGQLGLIALLPQVVDAVAPLPALAGGGIADRRGVSAALALGAAGVWVGTQILAAN